MNSRILAAALALLLLISAQAALAQSAVTLYVLADINVTRYQAGARAGGGSLTVVNDGHVNGLQGSRLGLRVAEDLGGGLRAQAVLEQGVLFDSGGLAQGGRAWGRQAWLGLSQRGLGDVRAGRQYLLSDSLIGESAPFGNGLTNNVNTSVSNLGRSLPMFFNAPRVSNALTLSSAGFGGFTVAGQLAAGEGSSDRFHGLRAAYQAGKGYLGLSYEWNEQRRLGTDVNRSLTLVGNFDFGTLKLLGGWQRNTKLDAGSGNGAATGVALQISGPSSFTMDQADSATFGVEVPVSAALALGLNHTRARYEGASGASATLRKAALGARYSLSKRTFLYAGVSLASGSLRSYIDAERVLMAGMRVAH